MLVDKWMAVPGSPRTLMNFISSPILTPFSGFQTWGKHLLEKGQLAQSGDCKQAYGIVSRKQGNEILGYGCSACSRCLTDVGALHGGLFERCPGARLR